MSVQDRQGTSVCQAVPAAIVSNADETVDASATMGNVPFSGGMPRHSCDPQEERAQRLLTHPFITSSTSTLILTLILYLVSLIAIVD